jgi:hypothetical protein
LAVALAAAAHAQDSYNTCESYPDIPINVTARFDEPAYDYTVDLAALQALAHDPRYVVHGGHTGLTLGLTRYQPLIEFKVPVQTMEFSDALACARVDHVDVTFGYQAVTVYVPREIPQGSCGFDQVFAHEEKHIAVNRQILDEYVPRIEDSIKDSLRLNGVLREQNADYAVALLKQKLQSILDEAASEIFTENVRRQKLVDSPEEYRRVSAACDGQLVTVAAQFQQGNR